MFMGQRTSVEVGGEKRGTLAKRCQRSCDLYFLDAVYHHGAVAAAVGHSRSKADSSGELHEKKCSSI